MPGLHRDAPALEHGAPVDLAILEGGVLAVEARIDDADANVDDAAGGIRHPIDQTGSIAALGATADGRGADRLSDAASAALHRRHVRPIHVIEGRERAR